MGGIFAKIDNQDKIIHLEKTKSSSPIFSQNKGESDLNLFLLKNYFNKYGYISIEMDLKQLELYINFFNTKYLTKNINNSNKIDIKYNIIPSVCIFK